MCTVSLLCLIISREGVADRQTRFAARFVSTEVSASLISSFLSSSPKKAFSLSFISGFGSLFIVDTTVSSSKPLCSPVSDKAGTTVVDSRSAKNLSSPVCCSVSCCSSSMSLSSFPKKASNLSFISGFGSSSKPLCSPVSDKAGATAVDSKFENSSASVCCSSFLVSLSSAPKKESNLSSISSNGSPLIADPDFSSLKPPSSSLSASAERTVSGVVSVSISPSSACLPNFCPPSSLPLSSTSKKASSCSSISRGDSLFIVVAGSSSAGIISKSSSCLFLSCLSGSSFSSSLVKNSSSSSSTP